MQRNHWKVFNNLLVFTSKYWNQQDTANKHLSGPIAEPKEVKYGEKNWFRQRKVESKAFYSPMVFARFDFPSLWLSTLRIAVQQMLNSKYSATVKCWNILKLKCDRLHSRDILIYPQNKAEKLYNTWVQQKTNPFYLQKHAQCPTTNFVGYIQLWNVFERSKS